MAPFRFMILIAALFELMGYCGGQLDPPQRFEAKKSESDRRKAAEKNARRARVERERRREQHERQKPHPGTNEVNHETQPNDEDNSEEIEGEPKSQPRAKIDFNKISANSKAQEIFPWNNLFWKRQSELLQELRDEMYIDMEEVFVPKSKFTS